MSKTIRVVPAQQGIMANGEVVSKFSSGVIAIVNTGRFTWEVVDQRGTMTTGLCRVPALTLEEAELIAAQFAEVRGYTVLDTKS